jgi:hypothetical protein
MLSADEHPGLIYCMIGVVVIVMTAIGLSVIMDRRSVFTSGARETRETIEWDGAELDRLKVSHTDESSRLARELPQRLGQSKDLAKRVGEAELMLKRQADLIESQRQLLAEVSALEADFSNYRRRYRQATWSGVSGEKLGTVKVRGGREYLDAVIVRVTDVGLEIRHKDGFARLQAPDLSDIFQSRFQWSDDERQERLSGELENQRKAEAVEVKNAEPARENIAPVREATLPSRPMRGPEEIHEQRVTVAAWKAKVARIQGEITEAASWGGSGNQSSLPGKLETWKAKETRLRSELIRARTGLSLAQSKLAEISPNDPALIMREGNL